MLGRIGRVTVGLAVVRSWPREWGPRRAYKVSATLNAKQEIPKQVVKAPNAKGGFSGTYVEHGKSATLRWKLTFSGLSGEATAAHIHLGKRVSPAM